MKKKNKGEIPLWREANYYIGWLFIVIYVAIQFLYQYRISNEVSAHGIISPVPDSYSDELANQLYFTYEPAREEEEIEVEETIDELITFYCEKYGVREDLVRCVVANESSFNHLAVGDSGKAKGLAQFWLGTWRSFRKLMGLDDSDMRTDKAESIKTLVFALSQGKGYHWSPIKDGRCR